MPLAFSQGSLGRPSDPSVNTISASQAHHTQHGDSKLNKHVIGGAVNGVGVYNDSPASGVTPSMWSGQWPCLHWEITVDKYSTKALG